MSRQMSPHETLVSRYELPGAAHHPNSAHHDSENVGTGDGPTGVNSIQHAIRAGIAERGLREAKSVIKSFGPFERDELLPDFGPIRAELETADTYMQNEIGEHLDDIDDVLDRRERWYEALITGDYGFEIGDEIKKARKLKQTGSRIIAVTIDVSNADQAPFAARTINPNDIHYSPTRFGYDLPHTYLAVNNGGKSGSIYPLVPWYGIVVCTCYAKQNQDHAPACKHELFAVDAIYNENQSAPSGLPRHYQRLVHEEGRNLYHRLQKRNR